MGNTHSFRRQQITHSRLLELLHYDPLTGVFTNRITRARALAGAAAGSLNGDGYLKITLDQQKYYAHRLAWFYMTGEWPNPECDHKNRVRSDNRFENLFAVSHGQNKQNRDGVARCKAGVRGVRLSEAGRWEARIAASGRRVHLGTFDTIEAASAAYSRARETMHYLGVQHA